MHIENPIKALNNTVLVASGLFVGGISGARGDSVTNNLLWSGGLGLIGSGLNTALGSQSFFSKQTLVETLIFTASSAVMHLLAKSASDQRTVQKPVIAFAPDCNCKQKSWAEKVARGSAENLSAQR